MRDETVISRQEAIYGDSCRWEGAKDGVCESGLGLRDTGLVRQIMCYHIDHVCFPARRFKCGRFCFTRSHDLLRAAQTALLWIY